MSLPVVNHPDDEVDGVIQAWRRVKPIGRAGLHAEQPELADALDRLDKNRRFDFTLDD